MDVNRIVSILEQERPKLTARHRERIAKRLAGRLWAIKDVAELYGVGWATVRRWIKRGELNARRDGYNWVIDPEDAVEAPGRFAKGWYRRKLSAKDAIAVRQRAAQGEAHRRIAEDYDIHESLVTRIINKERYGDIEEDA